MQRILNKYDTNTVWCEKGWVLWFQRVKDRFVLRRQDRQGKTNLSFTWQDKSVFHMLEPENPTFLMTTPVEKPSLNCMVYSELALLHEIVLCKMYTLVQEKEKYIMHIMYILFLLLLLLLLLYIYFKCTMCNSTLGCTHPKQH